MNPLIAPALAASALLVLAGLPKTLRPRDAVGALASVGRPVPPWLVRLGGLVEAGIGAATLVAGDRWLLALTGLSYAGFTGFVVVALRRGGSVATCGCLGRPDTPPTRTHVAVTATLAATCFAAIAGSPVGLARLDAVTPPRFAAMLVYVALLVALTWLLLAELPRLRPARRPVRG